MRLCICCCGVSLIGAGASFWAGFLTTLAFLVGSLSDSRPRWIEQWIKVLLGYHRYATPAVDYRPARQLESLSRQSADHRSVGQSAALLAWRNRRATPDSLDFWLTLSLLLAITSVTLLPGQAIYDHVILLPGIFLLLRYRRELSNAGRVPRTLLAIGAVVLFWPYGWRPSR